MVNYVEKVQSRTLLSSILGLDKTYYARPLTVHLEPYDEVNYTSTTSIYMGGVGKGAHFFNIFFPTFACDPLDQLVNALRTTFSARYNNNKYSAEDIKEARDFAAAYGDKLKANLLPGPYVYGARMDSVRGRLGEDLKVRRLPVISSLLKGWGLKVPSRYLYIQSRHNYL